MAKTNGTKIITYEGQRYEMRKVAVGSGESKVKHGFVPIEVVETEEDLAELIRKGVLTLRSAMQGVMDSIAIKRQAFVRRQVTGDQTFTEDDFRRIAGDIAENDPDEWAELCSSPETMLSKVKGIWSKETAESTEADETRIWWSARSIN